MPDQPVVTRCRNQSAALSCLLAIGMACADGHAQGADPTRPPDALLRPAAASQAAPEATAPALQLILRPRHRPASALINGKRMSVGQEVDGVRLVALGTAHADVVTADKPARLSLTPDVSR